MSRWALRLTRCVRMVGETGKPQPTVPRAAHCGRGAVESGWPPGEERREIERRRNTCGVVVHGLHYKRSVSRREGQMLCRTRHFLWQGSGALCRPARIRPCMIGLCLSPHCGRDKTTVLTRHCRMLASSRIPGRTSNPVSRHRCGHASSDPRTEGWYRTPLRVEHPSNGNRHGPFSRVTATPPLRFHPVHITTQTWRGLQRHIIRVAGGASLHPVQ